ncbi:RCC1 domain-containing protein [Nonomuraea sp. SBT364]|uniref:RCC1 domain-containing protein n=1 Tax=Nonomuraea sp. SBT364 TaxID=1580530 RepID=UPI0009ECA7FE|nr:RCC1 domain-containing protein [Nonomuraea sp. SBT364]
MIARSVLVAMVLVGIGRQSGPAIAASPNQGWAWGSNSSGELGDGGPGLAVSPVTIDQGTVEFRDIAAGRSHSVALDHDGRVWAWGANDTGQLGQGMNTPPVLTPKLVPGLTDIVQVAANGDFSLALSSAGVLFTWGSNSHGQLGDGTQTTQQDPTKLLALTGITRVAAGDRHTLALVSGRLWSWGSNADGQLGNGTTTDASLPLKVLQPDGEDFVDIEGGAAHSLALSEQGRVWSWGSNFHGQLGDGTFTQQLEPVFVDGMGFVKDIAAGGRHSLATTFDVTYGWGDNGLGQLGIGVTSPPVPVPKQALDLEHVVEVAASLRSSAALSADGTVWTWGNNHDGQLGNGSLTSFPTPKPVPPFAQIARVTTSSASRHVLAIEQ